MDVDLLRPGTVPISPDTILWFEFLLSEDILLKHLQKPSPDPTPIDLINKFTSVVFETATNEVKRIDLDADLSDEDTPKYTSKQLALKILSLKVAAFINWDFAIIQNLSFKYQLNLMQDLLYFTNNQTTLDLNNLPEAESLTSSLDPFVFALILYHRWIIKNAVRCILPGQPKISNDFLSQEEVAFNSPENIEKSLNFLKSALVWNDIPPFLTIDCFVMLKEGNTQVQNDWSRSVSISKYDFYSQISYDLAVYYFFKEDYSVATSYFTSCKQNISKIESECPFLKVDVDELDGYCMACNTTDDGNNLLLEMHNSIVNHYMGIVNILQQDNLCSQIPINYRINLELDIRGAISSGKFTVARDLLPKIEALNAVRSLLSQTATYRYEINKGNVEAFIWAATPILNNEIAENKHKIKSFFIELLLEQQNDDLLNIMKANEIVKNLLSDCMKMFDKTSIKKIEIPEILNNKTEEVSTAVTVQNKLLEVKKLEQQIISCYDPQELRQMLLRITSKGTVGRPIWNINRCWELPIPLQSVLVSMPPGFLQDFSFILLAKSRELMLCKNWDLSLKFLNILKTEVQSGVGTAISKLSLLITWEVLLVKINQLLEEWPAPNLDKKELAQECEACLQSGESVLPRAEIMEYCALCLLSLGHWEFLLNYEKRWTYFEIAASIASACQDLIRYKGNKKFSRDLWDMVLPVFTSPPSQSKRSSSGATSVIHRDSPTSNTKSQFITFFSKLRDSTILTVVISMLARLYNVLRDESSLELSVDYIMLWPIVISNTNSYNSRSVLEVLTELLRKSLYFYPTNVSWMRLMGDINFVNGYFEESLNYYLKSLLVVTDNFSLPLRNDDHVIKRMIKCCSALSNHTQAAILCQFLEEPDYSFAFHSLSEQKLCADSVDSYYHCFWDTTILEYLVNLHQKRAEYHRRKCAVHIIGLLEINSNNNEEIQHEASNLRKSVFLRALCKQYVH